MVKDDAGYRDRINGVSALETITAAPNPCHFNTVSLRRRCSGLTKAAGIIASECPIVGRIAIDEVAQRGFHFPKVPMPQNGFLKYFGDDPEIVSVADSRILIFTSGNI